MFKVTNWSNPTTSKNVEGKDHKDAVRKSGYSEPGNTVTVEHHRYSVSETGKLIQQSSYKY